MCKGIVQTVGTGDICALTMARTLVLFCFNLMDTTAFIRKINGEVSRMETALPHPPAARADTTFTKKKKLGADMSKSKKREMPVNLSVQRAA